MKFQCKCHFYARDKSPVFVFEVESSSIETARLMARAECLASGFALPKRIDVKQLGVKKAKLPDNLRFKK